MTRRLCRTLWALLHVRRVIDRWAANWWAGRQVSPSAC